MGFSTLLPKLVKQLLH